MKTLSVMMVVLMILASTTNTEAQKKYQFNKNSIESLRDGITSKNNGLRRSAIYMAGFYEISEVSNTLCDELKNEINPAIKVLIALTLYKIGDENSLKAIENLSKTERDDDTRRMMFAITEQIKRDRIFTNPVQ
jgi:ATP-dependent helicase/DNAse subunit B